MNATALLAEFVTKSRYEDCPETALDAARRAILDCLGVMLAGSVEPAARPPSRRPSPAHRPG